MPKSVISMIYCKILVFDIFLQTSFLHLGGFFLLSFEPQKIEQK